MFKQYKAEVVHYFQIDTASYENEAQSCSWNSVCNVKWLGFIYVTELLTENFSVMWTVVYSGTLSLEKNQFYKKLHSNSI